MALSVSLNTIIDEIYGIFNAEWGNKTKILYGNIDYDTSYSQDFVNVKVVPTSFKSASLGTHHFRNSGVVLVKILAKNNNSYYNVNNYIDAVHDIFGNRITNNVFFGDSETNFIGESPTNGGAWTQANISIGYTYDNFR